MVPHRMALAEFTSHWHLAVRGFMENFQMPPAVGFLMAGLIAFPGVVNQWVWYLLGLAFLSVIVDFAAGVYFAFRRRDEHGEPVFNVELLYDGGWRKVGRTFLVIVAAMLDAFLWIVANFVGQDAVSGFTELFPWTMLACAWIVVGEISSTLQTITLYGGDSAVPEPMRRVVYRLRKWLLGQDGAEIVAGIPKDDIRNRMEEERGQDATRDEEAGRPEGPTGEGAPAEREELP